MVVASFSRIQGGGTTEKVDIAHLFSSERVDFIEK
jgi:hypothetical protein